MTVDRVSGALFVLAGVAAALEAGTYDVAFMTDPVGPKALPYLVAFTLVAAGMSSLLRPRTTVPLPSRRASLRMAGAVVAFLIYAAALPLLGFFAATSMVVVALALLYRGPIGPSVAAALGLSGLLWLLFASLLSLPLPIGDLWIR